MRPLHPPDSGAPATWLSSTPGDAAIGCARLSQFMECVRSLATQRLPPTAQQLVDGVPGIPGWPRELVVRLVAPDAAQQAAQCSPSDGGQRQMVLTLKALGRYDATVTIPAYPTRQAATSVPLPEAVMQGLRTYEAMTGCMILPALTQGRCAWQDLRDVDIDPQARERAVTAFCALMVDRVQPPENRQPGVPGPLLAFGLSAWVLAATTDHLRTVHQSLRELMPPPASPPRHTVPAAGSDSTSDVARPRAAPVTQRSPPGALSDKEDAPDKVNDPVTEALLEALRSSMPRIVSGPSPIPGERMIPGAAPSPTVDALPSLTLQQHLALRDMIRTSTWPWPLAPVITEMMIHVRLWRERDAIALHLPRQPVQLFARMPRQRGLRTVEIHFDAATQTFHCNGSSEDVSHDLKPGNGFFDAISRALPVASVHHLSNQLPSLPLEAMWARVAEQLRAGVIRRLEDLRAHRREHATWRRVTRRRHGR